MASNGSKHTNRLAQEKSPYLLQHAHNPVDWYPWGDAAFAKARAEQKPIFLSIGYSTCHWCHVMERESFENPEVAAVMNELFVNVKVDREERPDVDRVYMSYVQAISGSGGWPMSVFLTPELEPFFGGTYFPPEDRYGRPGFLSLLQALDRAWTERRADVVKSAQNVLGQLRQAATEASPDLLDASAMQNGYRVLERSYDPQQGGFGDAPKFPRAATFSFLLRHYDRTRESRAGEMVVFTLRKMAAGGMYDQLGGGFHRYSVDRRWHVPHFEKMLYDQAQLVRCYLEGHQLTGDPQLARIARETCNYVLRDLTDSTTGGFFSAEDADSLVAADGHEKKEGAFYVFAYDDLVRLLTPDQLRVFAHHYGCVPEGNAEDPHGELTGKNVLHEDVTLEETAATTGFSLERTRGLLEQAREKALALRNTRPRPHLDDKILCAWNGLMISALARASQVLGATQYLDAAVRAATFVTSELFDAATGTLYRRWRDGERAFPGFLEDHAFLAEGLVDLYEASFDTRWLRLAETLTERMVELFADPVAGGFFSTSGRDPSVLVRLKEDHDGAEPAGSSVAVFNLLRLAELVGREEWSELAHAAIRCFGRRLRETPHAMPLMLGAWDLSDRGAYQIVIAGDRESPNLPSILEAIHRAFVPNKVLLLADEKLRRELGARLPYIQEMKAEGGTARAFVCRERACSQPTSDAEQVAALLAAPPRM